MARKTTRSITAGNGPPGPLSGGVGALSSSMVPDVRELLPSVGVGLRVELLRRVTVRLDVGFGRESRAVYFNFLEAF
mgnify:CR=1 FL=1